MFVRYYLELQRPFEGIEAALLNHPEAWVPGLAEEAESRSERLLGEVGFGEDRRRVSKQIVIELGEAVQLPSKTLLPMSWQATGAKGLFPVLEADIEVARLGAETTQLSVSARYRPPLGAVGKAIDRALLHRVAEATVKDFLDRVGETLSVGDQAKT